MAALLDTFPFPWHIPEAQQLHLTLAQLYSTVPGIMSIAQNAGINTLMIDSQQPPYYLWRDVIKTASADGLLRALVQGVNDKLNENSSTKPFIQDVLSNQPIVIEAEPRDIDGAPNFIKDTDNITEPEALMFRDDLTLQIGKIPALIATLQEMLRLAPSVCKLVIDVSGQGQFGTAFRIGSDLLLTNWHVLHDRRTGKPATAVTAEFGYEDNGIGGTLSSVNIPCNLQTVISNKEDDWGIIRSKEALLDKWPIIALSEGVVPIEDDPAYIIQHPRGDRKRIGFIRNQVSSFDDRIVQYLTDTQEGSSGAPVFDNAGKLIALHHAGGRPQEVLGKVPIRKNEGIRISRVRDGLQQKGVLFS